MAFDMKNINNQVNSGIDSLGGQIQSQMSKVSQGEDLSEQDMLKLQYDMNRWNILVSMATNIQKTWADTIKQIVSNLR